jgi:hypothetical protein
MSHLLPSVARILVPTLIAAVAVGISAPHALPRLIGAAAAKRLSSSVRNLRLDCNPSRPASTTYELLTRITSRRLAGNGPHARHCSAEWPTGTTEIELASSCPTTAVGF